MPTTAPEETNKPRLSTNQRPGTLERVFVGLTFVVFAIGLPTKWGFRPGDIDPSNPLLTVARVGLPSIAMLRVLGNLDLFIAAIRANAYAVLFAALALASLFWSADPALSAQKGLEFALATAFACYLAMRFDPIDLLRILVVAGSIVCVIHLAFVVGLPTRGRSPAGFTGVHGQKNGLGQDMGLFLILVLFAIRSLPRWRVPLYPIAIASAVLLAGSQSVTSILVVSLTLALWPLFLAFRGRRTMPGVVLFGLAASGSFAALVATANLGRLTAALGKDITFTGRTAIWVESLPIAMERALVGWGFEAAFTGYFGPLHEAFVLAGWSPSHAHNAVLQVLIELGLVGVVLFIGLYVRAFRSAIAVASSVRRPISMLPLVVLSFGVLLSLAEIGPLASPYLWVLTVYCAVAVGRDSQQGIRPPSGLPQRFVNLRAPLVES